MKNPIHFLRMAGLVEAVSYMLLVGIAMPLKYIWGWPKAVSVVGMIHGILFVIFCVALARAAWAAKWPPGRTALVFAASLIPFGPFVLDRRIRGWQADFEAHAR